MVVGISVMACERTCGAVWWGMFVVCEVMMVERPSLKFGSETAPACYFEATMKFDIKGMFYPSPPPNTTTYSALGLMTTAVLFSR